MVRLITSRLHRCYSRHGVQRSAAIEKTTTAIHIIACIGLMLSVDLSAISTRQPFVMPASLRILACLLLSTVHLSDLYATVTAHRKFYRWSKAHKRPIDFLSTPTKVDALTVILYLCASTILLASATGLVGNAWENGIMPMNINAYVCILCALAAFTNVVLALPSMDFNLPSGMARLQSLISTVFCVACVVKLQCALLPMVTEVPANLTAKFMKICFFADVMILVASLVNVVRVIRFLNNTVFWAMGDTKPDTNRGRKGLLAWFKASPTEGSDMDSEDLDEYEGDYDDEEWQKTSPRRSAV